MGKLSPLRRRMIEDMRVRNLSPATQEAYVRAVEKLSRYFGRSPGRRISGALPLGPGSIRVRDIVMPRRLPRPGRSCQPDIARHRLEDLRVTRHLAGRWSFSRSHEHGGGASAEPFLSESNFSTYCKTTHT
jgi:hypothetical protein